MRMEKVVAACGGRWVGVTRWGGGGGGRRRRKEEKDVISRQEEVQRQKGYNMYVDEDEEEDGEEGK